MSEKFLQITPEELAAKERAQFEKGRAEGKTEAEATAKEQVAAAQAAGAAKERDRVKDVLSIPHVGHEELIAGLAFDGKSSKADAALAIIEAEKSTRSKVRKDLKEDAPNPLPDGGDPAKDAASDRNLTVEERCKKNWASNKDEVRDNFMNFEGYVAFEKNFAAGNIRMREKGAK